MNKDNIDKVFQLVRLNKLEILEREINSENVNQYINEYKENLLQEAIAHQRKEISKYLLYCNIDVNHTDKNGRTPLHFSTAHNDIESTKMLLDSNMIEIDKKDVHGNNPLWVAVFNARGYYEIVKLLKLHGANPNSKNNNNKSSLDFAIQIGDEKMVEILKA